MARRALVLSPEFPFPPHGGGALRTLSLIEYLRRTHTVDLITFHEDAATPVPGGMFESVLQIPLRRHSRELGARLWRNAWRTLRQVPPLVDRFQGYRAAIAAGLGNRHYDVAVVEHLWAAPYAPLLRPAAKRLVLDLHNVESVLQRRLRLPFAAASRRLERRWVPAYDRTLVTSPADAEALGLPAVVYRNGIPPRDPPRRDPNGAARMARIAMSGNFEFPPNRRGLRWFLRHAWPRVRRATAAELHLIGLHSGQHLGPEGVTASGQIEDAVAELATARLAIVPLQAGSGTRLKILEAWQARTPVVSTRLGAEGLPVEDGLHLRLADSPEEFAQAICALWSEHPARQRLATAGEKLLNARFTWPAIWAGLDHSGALY